MPRRMHRRSKEEMSDPSLQKEIADLYRSGTPIWKLRRKFRCGDSCVRAALEANGVERRERVPPEEEVWAIASTLLSRLSPEARARREVRMNVDEWEFAFNQEDEVTCG